MNDVIWYSRFAVLVGALVLLVQAIAGRGTSVVTLIGVLLLCIGFVVFITALSFQGRGWSLTGPGTVSETDDAEIQHIESPTGERTAGSESTAPPAAASRD